MINSLNPWITMSPASQRRIDSDTLHNLFWIKDMYGNYGFCLQTGNGYIIDENTINLRGISIIKRNTNTGIVELFLMLSQREEWEIFLALCEDLVSVTKKYNSDFEMINAVENRLRRWQQLLKAEKNYDFSFEKQMGLFSELLCLKDFVVNRVGIRQSINSWVGPDSDKQDFLLDELAIEVKSHRTSKGNVANISSYQQLNSDKDALYLFSYSLTSSENGQSVEDISKLIAMQFNGEPQDRIELFEYKLLQYGYIPELNKEALHKFIVDNLKVYHVTDTFPKIFNIRSEIISVKYTIDLSQCSSYEVNVESLLRSDNND